MASKDYANITSIEQLRRLAAKMVADGKPVGFDLETGYTGPNFKKRAVDHYNNKQFVVGFSFTNDEGWARYVPIAHDDGHNIDASAEEVWDAVREMLTVCDIVCHNAKFEAAAVWKAGKILLGSQGSVTCTMLDTFIVGIAKTPNWRTMIALKQVIKEFFDHQMMHIEELWPDMPVKDMPYLRFNTTSALDPKVTAYACEDAVWVLPLANLVSKKAIEERPFMHNLELEIMKLMVEVERFGVHIDWDSIENAYAQAQTFVPEMENFVKEELGKLAGRDLTELNLNSALQIKKLLFKEIGMVTTRLTKKAQEDGAGMEDWQKMSSDKKSLVALSEEYDAVKQLLEFREVKNLVNRLKKWLTEYNQADDLRVHANYKQAGAESSDASAPGSGRFSASDPAIQQLPKKWKWTIRDGDKNGVDYWSGNFRNFIDATPGSYLLTYDYSQVELRMLAGASQEPTLLEAFQNEDDVHTLTAAMMLGKAPHDVDRDTERPIGKTFNFALMYGMGPKSLSEQLGIDFDYAKALYAQYFEKFSNVAAWKTATENLGASRGYAETIFGRRIPVWELQSPSKAIQAHGMRLLINAPIQGSAADYMKIAMFRSASELRKRGWWGTDVCITMNQHDALTFEASNRIDPNELREILQPRVVFGAELSAPLAGYPPIRADWELGQRWGSSTEWNFNQEAAFDGEHWTVQPEPALKNLFVSFEHGMPVEAEWTRFIKFLKSNEGSTSVHLATPQGQTTLPIAANVTETAISDLRSYFRNATLTFE